MCGEMPEPTRQRPSGQRAPRSAVASRKRGHIQEPERLPSLSDEQWAQLGEDALAELVDGEPVEEKGPDWTHESAVVLGDEVPGEGDTQD